MARLQDPDKAIVYLNQVEEHIIDQDGDTNWVHSMLDEVNSMLEYCKNEAMKKKELLFWLNEIGIFKLVVDKI